jgi:hypothetical protein
VTLLWCALLGALLPVASLRAQGPPAIEIKTANGPLSPSVAVRRVLTERAFDDPLRHGFPVRLHVRTEAWTVGGWFDELVGSAEWDIIVRYDLIDKTYEVARVTSDAIMPLGSYARFIDARAATELPFSPPLRVNARGKRGYIAVKVDAQAVEMSDLDEVQRWLRGEARPMVQGRRSPGTALTRGLRTLVSRLLGGEVRHLEAKTPTVQF